MAETKLRIGDFAFASRLLVGTGKYATYELMRDAVVAEPLGFVGVGHGVVDGAVGGHGGS